jgi:hypothetical protein
VTDLDFYAEAILSGRVLGLGSGSTADEVERALGRDFVDDARKQLMRRDYGLIEFHFNRANREWVCFGVSIQVHRLADAGEEIVPPVLIGRYGAFGRSVAFGQLVDRIKGKAPGRAVECAEASGGFGTFRVDGTDSQILAVCSQVPIANAEAGARDLWSIELRAGVS